MQILSASEIDIDGFRGVRERQYVMAPSFFRTVPEHAWGGLGNLVYLADAYFVARGTTGLHSHARIDILTLLANGRVEHQGSLGDRSELQAGQAMLQQAGEQGFSHNERNLEDTPARIIQLWMKPLHSHQEARYHRFEAPLLNQPLQLYPLLGEAGSCRCRHWLAEAGQTLLLAGEAMLFVVNGRVQVSQQTEQATVSTGTLLAGRDLSLQTVEHSRLLLFDWLPE